MCGIITTTSVSCTSGLKEADELIYPTACAFCAMSYNRFIARAFPSNYTLDSHYGNEINNYSTESWDGDSQDDLAQPRPATAQSWTSYYTPSFAFDPALQDMLRPPNTMQSQIISYYWPWAYNPITKPILSLPICQWLTADPSKIIFSLVHRCRSGQRISKIKR